MKIYYKMLIIAILFASQALVRGLEEKDHKILGSIVLPDANGENICNYIKRLSQKEMKEFELRVTLTPLSNQDYSKLLMSDAGKKINKTIKSQFWHGGKFSALDLIGLICTEMTPPSEGCIYEAQILPKENGLGNVILIHPVLIDCK
jgi:hypothetical protein